VKKECSRGLVTDLVGFGEFEDAGLNKGFDGLLDEFRFGFVFEGGLDLVFELLAGGGGRLIVDFGWGKEG